MVAINFLLKINIRYSSPFTRYFPKMKASIPALEKFLSTIIHSKLNLQASLPITMGFLALFAIALLFYGWLASRAAKKNQLGKQAFTLVDAFTASVLGLWLISVIYTSFGQDEKISLPLILINCFVYICLISGLISFLGFRQLKPITLFGLRPSHPKKIITTAFLWLAACYPLIMMSQAIVQLLFGVNDDAQPIVTYFLQHPGWRERAAIISMAVVVAPIAEEFLFRGYIYGVLRRFAGRTPAIVVSSLLFAAMHLHLPAMLGLVLLATILCLLYERTGSLWANIMVHSSFNTISIIILLLFK